MDERVRAQMKKWVCFTRGLGSVTSLSVLNAAPVVLSVWILSVIDAGGVAGSGVQDAIVRTARLLRGEKCR
jgi:hypothetical protein